MSSLDPKQSTLEPTQERPATPTLDRLHSYDIHLVGFTEAEAIAEIEQWKHLPPDFLGTLQKEYLKKEANK